MKAFGKTDIGAVRKMNQDYMFISLDPVGPLPNLFIVADGMGGHKAGDYASRMAVEHFIDYLNQVPSGKPIRTVNDAIHHINRKVVEKSRQYEALSGMGTTFVAAFIQDGKLYVANVGDSRLYLIDDESICQVTEDHSFVGAMVRAGELTPEQARVHPDKNIITRAIGAALDVRVDFFEATLAPGDRILICSDGLTNMIPDDALFEIIHASPEPEDTVNTLVEDANAAGGFDNITAIVIWTGEEVNV